MSSYGETEEHQQLQAQRTALLHSCGNLRRRDDPEVMLIDQRLADGRWHHDHPGLTGSWRIAVKGNAYPIEDSRVPRFEAEAAARAWIERQAEHIRTSLIPLRLDTRQTIERKLAAAGYGEVA